MSSMHEWNSAGVVSIVIPIFNEEENVARLYDALNAVLPSLNRPYEIILVDDGSTDGTPGLLQELSERDAAVRILSLIHI